MWLFRLFPELCFCLSGLLQRLSREKPEQITSLIRRMSCEWVTLPVITHYMEWIVIVQVQAPWYVNYCLCTSTTSGSSIRPIQNIVRHQEVAQVVENDWLAAVEAAFTMPRLFPRDIFDKQYVRSIQRPGKTTTEQTSNNFRSYIHQMETPQSIPLTYMMKLPAQT